MKMGDENDHLYHNPLGAETQQCYPDEVTAAASDLPQNDSKGSEIHQRTTHPEKIPLQQTLKV